jgi:hypothetical protein
VVRLRPRGFTVIRACTLLRLQRQSCGPVRQGQHLAAQNRLRLAGANTKGRLEAPWADDSDEWRVVVWLANGLDLSRADQNNGQYREPYCLRIAAGEHVGANRPYAVFWARCLSPEFELAESLLLGPSRRIIFW